MKQLLTSVAVIALVLGSTARLASAEHHGDDPASTGASEGGGMMHGGGMHRMMHGDGMEMMDHGRTMMHHRMAMRSGHHNQGPAVIINIYPGGTVGMMGQGGMGMMGRDGMGMMGQGGMDMMGQGGMDMMGQGGMDMMGQGGMDMMGQGGMDMMDMGRGHGGMVSGDSVDLDRRLSADDVHGHMMERMTGGSTVGEVTVLDDDVISAEIVDPDGAVAGRVIVNRHSGQMMRVR